MVADPLVSFSEACGQVEALKVRLEGIGSTGVADFDDCGPALIVGRSRLADIQIDDPEVSGRHAYFQVVAGRIFCVDLGSRIGVDWGDGPRPVGWVDPWKGVTIGPAQIRFEGVDGSPSWVDASLPIFRSFHWSNLPEASLEFVGTQSNRAPWQVSRALVLLGRSPTCRITLPGPGSAPAGHRQRDGDAIREAVAHGAVAIGECGLDNHYDHVPAAHQRHVLAEQVALASELRRPIVLHTREAEPDTIAMLRDAESAGVVGVLHCFTGSHHLAEAGLAAGWYVSFSGIVTFKKWVDDALLQLVPDDRLLIESDAPYLAPVPHRGKRNESAFVSLTLARIAAARDTEVSRLGMITLANTQRVFGLPNALDPDTVPSH